MQSRRIAFLAAPLALSLYQVACVDDPTPTPVPPKADSGVVDAGAHDSGRDATVPGDAGSDADATAPTEAGEDATPTPTGVTVQVTSLTGPTSGVLVVYGDSAGAVIATEQTDVAGLATHDVPAGSQVTVLFGTAPNLRLTTILAVAPGDKLAVVDDTPASTSGSIRITAIPGAPPTGTASYLANVGTCGTSFSVVPASVAYQRDCVSNGHFPVLVEALDDSSARIGFTFLKSGDLATDAGTPSVALTTPWVTTTTTQTFTTTQTPSDATIFTGFSEVTAGVPLLSSRAAGGAAAVPDPTSNFVSHTGYADFVQREVGVQRSLQDSGKSITALAERVAPPTADSTTSYDLSTLLPSITGVTLDRTNAARPQVTFTSGASLAATDGAIARLSWQQAGDAGESVSLTWTIVAPPSSTSIATPALPASAMAWTPSGEAFWDAPSLAFVDATFVAGYAQARAGFGTIDPTSNLARNISSNFVPPLPAVGSVRVSGYTPPIR